MIDQDGYYSEFYCEYTENGKIIKLCEPEIDDFAYVVMKYVPNPNCIIDLYKGAEQCGDLEHYDSILECMYTHYDDLCNEYRHLVDTEYK